MHTFWVLTYKHTSVRRWFRLLDLYVMRKQAVDWENARDDEPMELGSWDNWLWDRRRSVRFASPPSSSGSSSNLLSDRSSCVSSFSLPNSYKNREMGKQHLYRIAFKISLCVHVSMAVLVCVWLCVYVCACVLFVCIRECVNLWLCGLVHSNVTGFNTNNLFICYSIGKR